MGKLVADRIVPLLPSRQPVVDAETRAEIERMLNTSGPGLDLTDLFESVWRAVPEAEWDELPHDLSINLDHYLYGAPKVKP